MDLSLLQSAKISGFVFKKYGFGGEETFMTGQGEILCIPTKQDILAAGVDYFSVEDYIKNINELMELWTTKNELEKSKVI